MQENDYRLMHIQRTERRSGSGGPGEYAWVWWVLLGGLLLLLILSRAASKKPKK
jgi:hypothetical protein